MLRGSHVLFQVKLEQNVGKPSRVIHIRNIPNDVTEAEIIHLGIPFGRVTNVLVLKGKNQAFLEMGDETSATSMVSYFSSCMAQLRGRAVYVQYSNHKELKTDQTHSNAVSIMNAYFCFIYLFWFLLNTLIDYLQKKFIEIFRGLLVGFYKLLGINNHA